MIPLNLSLQNFLSHDKSVIDFTKFNVALVLGTYDGELDQSNGSGKSSLLESMMWALFGKSRHKKKDGIVKKDRKNCKVEFIFKVDGEQYKITRRRDKVVGEADVVLEQLDGGVYKNISCDTNTATDDKIVDIINVNYEVFINSVYFKQNDISIFAEATPSKRKDILKSLLKLDVWDEYQQRARDVAKGLSVKIEEKNKIALDVDEISNSIQSIDKEISEANIRITEVSYNYDKLNSDLLHKTTTKQQLISNIEVGPENLKKIQKEYGEYKKRIPQIETKLSENNNTIKLNSAAIVDIQNKILLLNDKIKAKKDINMSVLNAKLIAGKTKEKIMREQIQHLEADIALGDTCPTCDKRLSKDDIKNLSMSRANKLKALKETHAEIVVKLNRAEAKAKEISIILEDGNRAEIDKSKLEVKLSKLKASLETCSNENKQLLIEHKKNQGRDFEKEIVEIKASFNKDELDKVEAEINALNNNIADIRALRDNINMDLGSKVRQKQELENTKNEQIKIKEELKKLNEDFLIYDKLRQYFGRDGIQAVIIENVIEELEIYTNDTLTKICNEPTSISIKTQKQNESGSWAETLDIEINIGGRTDDFETLSGGEQFRVSLALRLALSKILSKRMGGMIKFLLLDEVSSSLDDKGLKMFIDAIKQIGNEMKVLVITHDEKLKEQFDNIIIVNKTPEGSRAFN